MAVSAGVWELNAAGAGAALVTTVKGPAVALGRAPSDAVTLYVKLVVPRGGVPTRVPVLAPMDSQDGAPRSNAKVGAGYPPATKV